MHVFAMLPRSHRSCWHACMNCSVGVFVGRVQSDLSTSHLPARAPWRRVVSPSVSSVLIRCAIARGARRPSLCARRTATRICSVRGRHYPGFRVSRMCRWIGIGERLERTADLCIFVRPQTWESRRRVFTVSPIPNTSRQRGALKAPKSRRSTPTCVTGRATGPGHHLANQASRS